MDLEGIMPSEIHQTKANTVWDHLYTKSKKGQPSSDYNKNEADTQI